MAQEGYDELMALTDSRYRLSMIVARRAAQLKLGVPSLLDHDESPQTRNTVTQAMKELELHKSIRWGDEKSLPTTEEIRKMLERERREAREREQEGYTISATPTSRAVRRME